MRSSIEDYVKKCEACQKKARLVKKDRVKIKVIGHVPEAMLHLPIDIAGPIEPKSGRGHGYVLVVTDNFSKWIELIALKSLTAKETVDALVGVCARVGIPVSIQSDNASVSGLNKEIYKRLGIEM